MITTTLYEGGFINVYSHKIQLLQLKRLLGPLECECRGICPPPHRKKEKRIVDKYSRFHNLS